MRNKILLTLATIMAYFSGFGQSPNVDFKYALKLSNQSSFDYSLIRDQNGFPIGGSHVELFRPTPSFLMRTTKGNFLEFGLNSISLGTSGRVQAIPDSYRPYSMGMGVKAGYFFTFFKKKVINLVPSLGFEVLPSFALSRSQQVSLLASGLPNTYTFVYSLYPTNQQSFRAQTFLTPRVSWFPAKRFFMDASMNLGIMGFRYIHIRTQDPSLPSNQTDVRYSDLVPMYTIGLQLGFGLKL